MALAAFLAGLATPLAVKWVRARRWGLPVRVRVDPEEPRAEEVAGYLREIAVRLDERPERMRVEVVAENAGGRGIELDADGVRRLVVRVEGGGEAKVNLRMRWIADHPLPLKLPGKKTLYIEPVDANRFRVMEEIPFEVGNGWKIGAALLATAGVLGTAPEPAAFAAGAAIGAAMARS